MNDTPTPPFENPEGHGLRYMVIPESQSGHCCFDYTVVDTTKPFRWDTSKFEAVCECFSLEEAELVCSALNYRVKMMLWQGV